MYHTESTNNLKPVSTNHGSGFFAFCDSPSFSPVAIRRTNQMNTDIETTITVKPKVFLAAPHYHPDQHKMDERFFAIERKARMLAAKGFEVISPAILAKQLFPNDALKQLVYQSSDVIKMQILECKRFFTFRLAGWQFDGELNEQIDFAEQNGFEVEHIY